MPDFKQIIFKQYQEWKIIFWICFILNIISYLGFIVYHTYTSDDYLFYLSEVNHIDHGRWFAGFIYNTLLQHNYMPTLSPIIAIIINIFTGILISKLWRLSKETSLIVILLWCIHPYNLEAFNFRISTIIIPLSYLIASISILIASKGYRSFILSIILFYCAISIYQVAIGFTVALISIQFLLDVYRDNISTQSLRKASRILIKYISMMFLATIMYMIITKLMTNLFELNMHGRYQKGTTFNLKEIAKNFAYLSFSLSLRTLPIGEFILPFIGKLLIFSTYIIAAITIFKKQATFLRRCFLVIWLISIPLVAFLYLLPLEGIGHSLPWRMCMGVVIFFIGTVALTQESTSMLIRRSVNFSSVFLIIYFIFCNNSNIYKQHLANKDDYVMATRIISRIQSLPNYKPNMDLAIIGQYNKRVPFSRNSRDLLDMLPEYYLHHASRHFSITQSAFNNNNGKYAILTKYMKLECQKAKRDEYQNALDASKSRSAWPSKDSIFINNNTVVLILSKHKDGQ